jgi:polar amino acid transport system substrate-binding protein
MLGQYVKRMLWIAVGLAMLSLALGACGGGGTQSNDLLAQIRAKGVIRVSTDPNYAPQSFVNAQGDLDGFDIEVAKEIAKRLGVKAEFTQPDWELITAGGWSGQWDLSVGSMAITPERKKVLYFSTPYYYTPAQLAARADTGITKIEDFNGKTICVGSSTTYEDYLNQKLKLDSEIIKQVTGVKVKTYSTDQECIQALKAGRKEFEGVLTASTVVEEGIAAGAPIVKVGDPVFYESLAAALDKSAAADSASLVAAVSKAVEEMHTDGTLSKLSIKWFNGLDLTKKK